MDSQYHIQLLMQSLGNYFTPQALAQIVAANLGQDALRYQLGAYPEYHFDNNQIARSLAYVDSEHAQISNLIWDTLEADDSGAKQRAAFGRLSHSIQDFYAHSNYVDLWLEANGGLANSEPGEINGLDPTLLNHPRLFTGSFRLWFDLLYYIPGFRPLLRSIYLRPNSHEAMNLDNPVQGPKFYYAMAAAKQRTNFEYQRAADELLKLGGQDSLDRFWGRVDD